MLSLANTSVSVVAFARSQLAGGSLSTLVLAHSTHVPTNLLTGCGVGGSGSDSGCWQEENRVKANSDTNQIKLHTRIVVSISFFFIIVIFLLCNLRCKNTFSRELYIYNCVRAVAGANDDSPLRFPNRCFTAASRWCVSCRCAGSPSVLSCCLRMVVPALQRRCMHRLYRSREPYMCRVFFILHS